MSATTNAVFTDAVASQPPASAVAAASRASAVISEKQFALETADETGSGREQFYDDPAFPRPTEEEKATLRRVPGSIPWMAYLLCVVEFAERASYYGASQVFNNFMQFPLPDGGNGAGAPPRGSEQPAGALDKGLKFSNAFVLLFKFLAYTLPIYGAWIADTRIGRYPAILIGVLICGVAHIIQIFGALPSVLQKGHGLPPFIISLFILAIGAGIFKPNILPTVLDQYEQQHDYVTELKTGERVIIDPEMTINRISLIFYCFVNIGGFFPIGVVYAEKRIGFWLAFLLPGIIYFLLPLGLLLTYKKTKRVKPNGSEVEKFFQILAIAFKAEKGRFWRIEGAKPSALAAKGITTYKGKPIPWTDHFVDDVRRTLSACMMFLYFPIWYLNNGGIGSVMSSQAASMTTKGAPNDLINNFNPLTIILFVPLLTHVIYPQLQKRNMMPGRTTRITFGFTLAWISGIVGTLIQWYIYKTSPCGKHATGCKVGARVSPISVWVQMPVVILGAMSECFCQVTAYEIAYARSPKNMRALVMSIFLFMNALSSALAQVLTPAIEDPWLEWVWAAPAMALFVVTIVFHWRYRWMNDDTFMTYEEEENPAAAHGGGEVKDSPTIPEHEKFDKKA
ncbi:putative MFS peptide transporter [Trichodelitschia bisporula]|uniref:Putative MFS peptide transporter n=1 Tax=Trichodelitschia bisporula TaxID=703511 RepID=A0A6G1I9H3_9PEZI|nr:putative MFS peptide transporter [Trichodelitschia bisporula]